MMIKRILIYILVITCCGVKAQQLPLYNQYYTNPILYFPSYAGEEKSKITTSLIRNQQWLDYDGGVTNSVLSVDGYIKSLKAGVGLQITSNTIGIQKTTGIYGLYSYKMRLRKEAYFAIGIGAGVKDFSLNYSQIRVSGQLDFDANLIRNYTSPDVKLSASFNHEKLQVHLAIHQLIGLKTSLNNGDLTGYLYCMNSYFQLQYQPHNQYSNYQ